MGLKKTIVTLWIILGMLFGSMYSQTMFPVSASDISLLSHSGYLDLSNYYHVVGEVKNVGTATYHSIQIYVNFYDSSDNLIATRHDLTILDTLLPGRRSPFDIVLLDDVLSFEVDHYEISITQASRASMPYGLQITSYESFLDGAGAQNVVGVIKNVKGQTAENVKVVATFYDDVGDVIAATSNYIDPEDSSLASGGSIGFELMIDVDRSMHSDSYVLSAESIQYAVISEIPTTEPPPPLNQYAPRILYPSPNDGSSDVSTLIPSLNVTVSDRDGDAFDLFIITSPDVGVLNLYGETDGEFSLILNHPLAGNTAYEWRIGATDGEHWTNRTYSFTTEAARPPIVSRVSPVDGSKNVSIALKTLNFAVKDPDEGSMDYYVSLEPGGLKAHSRVGDGNYSVSLSSLQYGTAYVWKLGVKNGNLWTNRTYSFTTEVKPSQELPLMGYQIAIIVGLAALLALVLIIVRRK
jgi:hypothetical protein